MSRRRRMRDPRPDLTAAGMPRRDRKLPPGLEPKGAPQPNRHEVAILRRLGRRGAFVLATQREGKAPLRISCVFAGYQVQPTSAGGRGYLTGGGQGVLW